MCWMLCRLYIYSYLVGNDACNCDVYIAVYTAYINTRLTTFFRAACVGPYQKDKPFWLLLKQEMMGWQWHQLDHMQVICTSLQTYNYANTSLLSFYRLDVLPAA